MAMSLASGSLGAGTPAVQSSARTAMYVGIVAAELARVAIGRHPLRVTFLPGRGDTTRYLTTTG